MKWVEEICRTGIIPATARFTITDVGDNGKEAAGNGDGGEGGEVGSTMVDILWAAHPSFFKKQKKFAIYVHGLNFLISSVHWTINRSKYASSPFRGEREREQKESNQRKITLAPDTVVQIDLDALPPVLVPGSTTIWVWVWTSTHLHRRKKARPSNISPRHHSNPPLNLNNSIPRKGYDRHDSRSEFGLGWGGDRDTYNATSTINSRKVRCQYQEEVLATDSEEDKDKRKNQTNDTLTRLANLHHYLVHHPPLLLLLLLLTG
jgi:hypothetical protein